MDRRGFTFIELVLLIAVVGILAVVALPKFLNLSGDADEAAREGVASAVRSGIALYRANDVATRGGAGSYPQSLERGSECCFTAVLTSPVGADEGWKKLGRSAYRHVPTDASYTYNPDDGTFARNP